MLALRDQVDIRRILDVGIFKGGSAALYAKLFQPEKLAIEYMPQPVEALTSSSRTTHYRRASSRTTASINRMRRRWDAFSPIGTNDTLSAADP